MWVNYQTAQDAICVKKVSIFVSSFVCERILNDCFIFRNGERYKFTSGRKTVCGVNQDPADAVLWFSSDPRILLSPHRPWDLSSFSNDWKVASSLSILITGWNDVNWLERCFSLAERADSWDSKRPRSLSEAFPFTATGHIGLFVTFYAICNHKELQKQKRPRSGDDGWRIYWYHYFNSSRTFFYCRT